MSEVTYGPGVMQDGTYRKRLIGGVAEDAKLKSIKDPVANNSIFYLDMAQSRYFTLTISKLTFNGKPIQFKLGTPIVTKGALPNKFDDFFPVKNISVSFTSYNNMSIPFSIFGNLPILHKKSVAKITINAYDLDDDRVERAVQAWEKECFPDSNYVAYLDDVKAQFVYKSYDVKGKQNYSKTLYVIPADNVSVSRSYDDNNEKIVSFSVVAVGEPGASSRGSKVSKPATIVELDTKAEIVESPESQVQRAAQQVVQATDNFVKAHPIWSSTIVTAMTGNPILGNLVNMYSNLSNLVTKVKNPNEGTNGGNSGSSR